MFNQSDYKYLCKLLELSSQQYRIDKVFISSRRLHRSILNRETVSWTTYSSFFNL